VIQPACRISGNVDGQAAAGAGRAAVWSWLPSARFYALIRGWPSI